MAFRSGPARATAATVNPGRKIEHAGEQLDFVDNTAARRRQRSFKPTVYDEPRDDWQRLRPAPSLRRVAGLEQSDSSVGNVRLWRLATRVHSLGAGRLYELFAELENGADLQEALERFAAIAIYREFSRAAARGAD
jgi:hypothetical protein